MTLPAGIHTISMSDYLALKALSAGVCHTILTQSPYHAKFAPWEEASAEMDVGTAIHSALLEGVDNIVAIEADDWRTKAAKEARDAVRKEGKIPMLARNVAKVQAAVDAAKAYVDGSEITGVFDDGKPEQTIIWNEGAILCKARPDWLTDSRDVLLHVKTTDGSAEPSSWIRNQLVRGYDVASAFYERGLCEVIKETQAPMSVFLVIEQNPPYGCSLVGLSPAMQDLADRKVARGIALWAKCKASGKYPAYAPVIHYAEPFAWQMAEEEEKQMFSDDELSGGIPL